MLQQWGIPKTCIILTILFVTGLFLTGFMHGLAYSDGLAVQATEVSGMIRETAVLSTLRFLMRLMD